MCNYLRVFVYPFGLMYMYKCPSTGKSVWRLVRNYIAVYTTSFVDRFSRHQMRTLSPMESRKFYESASRADLLCIYRATGKFSLPAINFLCHYFIFYFVELFFFFSIAKIFVASSWLSNIDYTYDFCCINSAIQNFV